MGQYYSLSIRVKFTDEASAVQALNNFIDTAENTNFSIDERNLSRSDVWSLFRIIFADWGASTEYVQKEPDPEGFTTIENYFRASYGWAFIMSDAFKRITPYLADGSTLFFDGDEDEWDHTIINSKCELDIHDIEFEDDEEE